MCQALTGGGQARQATQVNAAQLASMASVLDGLLGIESASKATSSDPSDVEQLTVHCLLHTGQVVELTVPSSTTPTTLASHLQAAAVREAQGLCHAM